MPEISRFYGIVIMLYINEHNPPHFHVKYDELMENWNLARQQKNLNKIKPLD